MTRTILHLPDVARLTNIPIATLRHWRARGRDEGPPMFRLGRRVVAYADEVEAWIESQRQEQSA